MVLLSIIIFGVGLITFFSIMLITEIKDLIEERKLMKDKK